MADADVDMEKTNVEHNITSDSHRNEKMFSLKRWNAVAMWSWDVECDTCAICRVQVMGEFRFGHRFLFFATFLFSFFFQCEFVCKS